MAVLALTSELFTSPPSEDSKGSTRASHSVSSCGETSTTSAATTTATTKSAGAAAVSATVATTIPVSTAVSADTGVVLRPGMHLVPSSSGRGVCTGYVFAPATHRKDGEFISEGVSGGVECRSFALENMIPPTGYASNDEAYPSTVPDEWGKWPEVIKYVSTSAHSARAEELAYIDDDYNGDGLELGDGFDVSEGDDGWDELDGLSGFRLKALERPALAPSDNHDRRKLELRKAIEQVDKSPRESSSTATAVARFIGAIGGIPLHYSNTAFDRRRNVGGREGLGSSSGGVSARNGEQRRTGATTTTRTTGKTDSAYNTTDTRNSTQKMHAAAMSQSTTSSARDVGDGVVGRGGSKYVAATGQPFARGHFGEVWRARAVPWRKKPNDEAEPHDREEDGGSTDGEEEDELESERHTHIPFRCTGYTTGKQSQDGGCAGSTAGTQSQEKESGFVLKRMFVERGEEVRLSGRREAHFGELMRTATATWPNHPGAGHVVRYESAFELRSSGGGGSSDDDGEGRSTRGEDGGRGDSRSDVGVGSLQGDAKADGGADTDAKAGGDEEGEVELWLVFRDEGASLTSLMYTHGEEGEANDAAAEEDARGESGDRNAHSSSSSVVVVRPSGWWLHARGSISGRRLLRDILRQTIAAVAFTHAQGVGHRDIKPSNLLVAVPFNTKASTNAARDRGRGVTTVRLADFGSGVDAFSLTNLYGTEGPSAAQQTPEYSPPEILFEGSLGDPEGFATNENAGNGHVSASRDPVGEDTGNQLMTPQRVMAYDMWSVGVLALELLCLGTPEVFASAGGRTRAGIERRLRVNSEP